MKILLVEDNNLKREKIKDFITATCSCDVVEAFSYNKAISLARVTIFDSLILDMSMPTFDRTESDMGGRFRVFGGKEIAVKLKKFGMLPPFVVVTGYSEFKDESEKLDLVQISDLLKRIGNEFCGVIPFESSSSEWKDSLVKVFEDNRID